MAREMDDHSDTKEVRFLNGVPTPADGPPYVCGHCGAEVEDIIEHGKEEHPTRVDEETV